MLQPEAEKTVTPVHVSDVLADRYRVDKKIGEGGMGSVFIAYDLELDREVAVKMLASALVNEPELVERFEREARLMAKLDHPNLVPIYDVGRHQGRPYLVMKLLEGQSLVDVLRDRGGFNADALIALMRQLAAGLDYIHKRGFIHRDIKSGNIFLSHEGHATILDFGILRSRISNAPITRMGMVMGTPHYMAPEQALGLKTVDHRVDLYALAVVLFECLTGTLPFEADSEMGLIQMQAHQPPPEILDRAPWVPKAVAQMMRKALAKAPGDRFDSAAELVQALEQAFAAPDGHAGQPTVRLPSAPALPSVSARDLELVAPKKGRRLFALAALALVLLGGLGAVVWLRKQDATQQVSVVAQNTVFDAGVRAAVLAVFDAGDDTDTSIDAGEVAVAAVENIEPPDAGTKAHVVAPVRIKKGTLVVTSTHGSDSYWAQISIDGKPSGQTPLLLDLVPGSYAVTAQRQGFKTETIHTRIVAGKKTPVKFELRP